VSKEPLLRTTIKGGWRITAVMAAISTANDKRKGKERILSPIQNFSMACYKSTVLIPGSIFFMYQFPQPEFLDLPASSHWKILHDLKIVELFLLWEVFFA